MQSILSKAPQPMPLQLGLLERMWSTSKFLTTASIFHGALVIVAAVGISIDPRLVINELAWIKPLKFSISIAVYFATIAWLLSYIEKPRWLVKLIAAGTAFFLSIESLLVMIQAIRGVRSHYNFTTDFDAAVFSLMGPSITLLWVLNLVLVVLLLVHRFDRPLLKWSLVWGLVIAIIGGLMGFGMTEQMTPAQQAAFEAGRPLGFEGGHTFGAEDGGPGLPFVGWSTTHGDLRVAHFAGLHGLQILPLLGYAIERAYRTRLSANRRLALVFLAGAGYLGLVTTAFQQAVRGFSIISFDPLTVLISLILALVLAIGWLTIARPLRP